MTSRRTFLNACLLALGVRVPKAAGATPTAPFPFLIPRDDYELVKQSLACGVFEIAGPWAHLGHGEDGDILTYTDHGYCWVHVEP